MTTQPKNKGGFSLKNVIFDKVDSIEEFLQENEDIDSEKSESCSHSDHESDGVEDEILL